jgi:hypothetical protein
MATAPGRRADLNAWLAQSFQLIAFPTEPALDLDQHWWRELTGDEPELLKKRHVREEKGVFQKFQFSVTIDLIRIIWTAQPNIDAENPPEGVPVLGSFPDARDWFVERMEAWLPHCPPITRLAYCAKVMLPVKTREEGYVALRDYMHHLDVDPASTDLLYRINRRRPSGIAALADVTVNRLSTWGVQGYTLLVQEIVPRISPIRNLDGQKHGCSIELDINTAPERDRPIPSEVLPELFRTLVSFGDEIVQEGDVK